MKKIHDDPRPHFPYALAIAYRRWRWLEEEMPQDFRQQVSLACCEVTEKSVDLARAVDRYMYRLARAEGFWRPQKGLPRGRSAKWRRFHVYI